MYHLAIDWRRIKFFLSHRTVVPEYSNAGTVPDDLSLFLPAQDIQVIPIRDWLYRAAMHYRLVGCYDKVFRGVVFIFDCIADLLMFRQHWAKIAV